MGAVEKILGGPAEGEGSADADNEKKQLRKRKLTAKFLGHLTARIEGMKQVCKLDSKQVRLLEIAARGAVNESLRKGRKQYKDAVIGNELDTDFAVFLVGDTIHIGRRYQFTFLEEEPVWKQTLARVLTKEQLEKHRQNFNQQLRYQRTTALYAVAAKAEDAVAITQTQRQKLVALVDESLGDRRIVIGSRRLGTMCLAVAALNIEESKFAAILDEKQMVVFKKVKEEIDNDGLLTIRPLLLALDGSKPLDELRKLMESTRLAKATAEGVDDDD